MVRTLDARTSFGLAGITPINISLGENIPNASMRSQTATINSTFRLFLSFEERRTSIG